MAGRWFSQSTAVSTLLVIRIIQTLYYAPAGRYSADRGRSIIRVTFLGTGNRKRHQLLQGLISIER